MTELHRYKRGLIFLLIGFVVAIIATFTIFLNEPQGGEWPYVGTLVFWFISGMILVSGFLLCFFWSDIKNFRNKSDLPWYRRRVTWLLVYLLLVLIASMLISSGFDEAHFGMMLVLLPAGVIFLLFPRLLELSSIGPSILGITAAVYGHIIGMITVHKIATSSKWLWYALALLLFWLVAAVGCSGVLSQQI